MAPKPRITPRLTTDADEDAERTGLSLYASQGQRLANPSPLAMGGFATTLLTVSLAMMGFRGVSTQTVFVGNLCFVACVALLISAQWEMVRGNTFSYTVLSAFGLFYGGYGAIMIPALGIVDAYGGYTPEYYNAMGFFVLIWAVLDVFFLIASVSFNIVYIGIFLTVELCFALDASSYFALADGNLAASAALMKAAGVFGFLAGLLGFYTVAHYMFEDAFAFHIPMGDTSSIFKKYKNAKSME
ncbi:GPR1/FUN34/yaaH family-domain-containing protein [Hypoxylon trugodes]|uniref:GPR1/FUN34/yaaH family-domain-containing protein n=1 Tax=Hypoxylon trugodes TaxID=326681 RepID=UPI0021933C86|nr:GPR1/FUN34/yaaH family-domain-containing protein [Hypoxylon trugodes]KAI1394415.1 GPR1/FUN34/yaaH family-domain-containing protein [Hypoxylon trugodes]